MCAGYILTKGLSCVTGLLVFATYHECDPLKTRSIKKPDQLVPFFVMDVARSVPGLAGLFVAGVFSAALSTMSSGLNTLAGTIYEDFLVHGLARRDRAPTEFQASLIIKYLFGGKYLCGEPRGVRHEQLVFPGTGADSGRAVHGAHVRRGEAGQRPAGHVHLEWHHGWRPARALRPGLVRPLGQRQGCHGWRAVQPALHGLDRDRVAGGDIQQAADVPVASHPSGRLRQQRHRHPTRQGHDVDELHHGDAHEPRGHVRALPNLVLLLHAPGGPDRGRGRTGRQPLHGAPGPQDNQQGPPVSGHLRLPTKACREGQLPREEYKGGQD
ncbi:hypothetical protein FOCC_FOCC000349 [Frankliniella occidentalis]|nr:hypothetical protein FOCC_FOCC000349 [Frankliniella occidentalis]